MDVYGGVRSRFFTGCLLNPAVMNLPVREACIRNASKDSTQQGAAGAASQNALHFRGVALQHLESRIL
jgi:hypothetical protein